MREEAAMRAGTCTTPIELLRAIRCHWRGLAGRYSLLSTVLWVLLMRLLWDGCEGDWLDMRNEGKGVFIESRFSTEKIADFSLACCYGWDWVLRDSLTG